MGYTGFYFRVLEEGAVSKDDGLSLLHRHPKEITVSFANRIMHREKDNIKGIKQILEVEELSLNYRERSFWKNSTYILCSEAAD